MHSSTSILSANFVISNIILHFKFARAAGMVYNIENMLAKRSMEDINNKRTSTDMTKRAVCLIMALALLVMPAAQGAALVTVEEYKREVARDPKDVAAITRLGEAYWEEGNRRAGIKNFRRAIKISPEYPIPYFFLGKAYFFEGKPEKGMKEFDAFTEKMDAFPEKSEGIIDYYVSTMHYISSLYLNYSKDKEAMRLYRKILKLTPDDQEAHYNLGVCYYNHQHNKTRAYMELQKVIELDPESGLASMSKMAIERMRAVPDTRFDNMPSTKRGQGDLERVVRNQVMLGTPYISETSEQ